MSHFSTLGRKKNYKYHGDTYNSRIAEPVVEYTRSGLLILPPNYHHQQQLQYEIKYPASHKIPRRQQQSKRKMNGLTDSGKSAPKTFSTFPVEEMAKEQRPLDRFDFNVRFAVNGMSKFVPGNDVPSINKSILAGDFGDDSGMVAENSNSVFIGIYKVFKNRDILNVLIKKKRLKLSNLL